jgi:hypothetical protein
VYVAHPIRVCATVEVGGRIFVCQTPTAAHAFARHPARYLAGVAPPVAKQLAYPMTPSMRLVVGEPEQGEIRLWGYCPVALSQLWATDDERYVWVGWWVGGCE